ncbi:MAG: DUF3566 domain-containing protein [Propionibacteriaceae bacterium]|nr:DUF3566 domain-containing protein [Propionibacteriaceae bacterium]
MSDAPRWPGSDGGPGLDFSPNRTEEPADSPEAAASAADDQADESIEADSAAPDTADSGVADDGPAEFDPAGDDTQVHSPVSLESPVDVTDDARSRFEADSSLFRADAADADAQGVAPVPPRAAERVARTAQEWASLPVDAGAVGAGAAGAGAVGAGAVAGAATSRSFTGPLGLRGDVAEDADPLPLDEVAEVKAGAAKPAATKRRPRRTRKARLRVVRIDPWSVMKTTFLFAIAFGIMMVVATFVLWSMLAGAGTLEQVNTLLNQLFGDQNTEFDVTQILSMNRILGFSAILAAINVVIITALATLFAFLYNLAATMMGGLEVTLAED